MKSILAVLSAFIFCLSLMMLTVQGCDARSSSGGDLAPDFALKGMNGRTVRLSDFRGRNPVLLIFSTTWCPHCRKQVQENNDIYAKYRGKGLEVYHIDIQEPPDRIAGFIKRYQVKYPILLDSDGKVARDYRIVGVPAYVLIDRSGKVVCNPCRSVEKLLPSLFK